MNVLIVDDQISVISSMKSGIDWLSLGITNIYTALNAMDAWICIAKNSIDILLCDIEMPVENGLMFLRRCRAEGFDFECIFLTSHAEFFYAQEALTLRSFDYILQPARYEDIEKVIKRAIIKINQQCNMKTLTSYGKIALSQKPSLLKNLLQNESTSEEARSNLQILQELNILPSVQTGIYILIFQLISWTSFPKETNIWTRQAELLLCEFFSYSHCKALTCCSDESSMEFLLYAEQKSDLTFSVYLQRLNILFTQLSSALSCTAAIYTACACSPDELSACSELLLREVKNNVSLTPGIYTPDNTNTVQPPQYLTIEQLHQLELYITSNKADKAAAKALQYLDSLNQQSPLNFDTLHAFCLDYQQAFYISAGQLNIPLHECRQMSELPSPLTLQSAAEFMNQLADFFLSVTSDISVTEGSLDTVFSYIDSNLDKPLSRIEISKAVHLNPDYITRLVHRQTGVTLKEYITMKKMKKAKKLLLTTNLPISLVATSVGYDNFSHFCKVYKKSYGVIPSSERG